MNFQMYPVAYPITAYPIATYAHLPYHNINHSNIVSNVSNVSTTSIISGLSGVVDSSTVMNNTNTSPNMHNVIKNVANATLYRNSGWFNKAKVIVKHLHKNAARCFQCYDMIEYKDITYSRILNNNDSNNQKDTKRNIDYTNNQNIIGNIICLCKNCVNSNKVADVLPKTAPKSYSDILADYILNERFDLISDDIEKLHKKKMDIIDDKINYLKFNINEKKVILNNLINQNNKLSNNIELEVEKYKILNEQHIKNKELCENIKNQLLQFSIDLFRENKKLIDEQINKYTDLNNATKYSIPECKICMMNEINIAIQCGHVFCIECYNQLLKNKAQNNNNNDNNDNNDEKSSHSITCPTCRTESNTYIQLYL